MGKIIRIYHECEARIEKSVPRIAVWHHDPTLTRIMDSFLAHRCFYLFLYYLYTYYIYLFIYLKNKLQEVPEYAKMHFHMMTILDVLGKIARVR